eukprot:gene4814-9604_t
MIFHHLNLITLVLALYIWISTANFISIRGHSPVQRLPFTQTSSWPVWTYENEYISRVEGGDDEGGWVNPTSIEIVDHHSPIDILTGLYFPSDLPPPIAQPALGIVVANGSPRYIMPSMILTLDTPARKWRNRGLCSLPRAKGWVDLFAMYAPSLNRLKLYGYGQSNPELRFLEDQDGGGIWDNLFTESINKKNSNKGLLVPPDIDYGIDITSTFEKFKSFLSEPSIESNRLSTGYHFVDIPIPNISCFILPKDRMKLYLTDFEDPKRLINYENTEDLDLEPIAELDMRLSVIAAGGSSDYLPDAYVDLYEPGNIIFE